MWHDVLSRTEYLRKLYKEIPPLNDVRIARISIGDEGNRVTMLFDIPKYADFPPDKWKGCNAVVIEIDFFVVTELKIDTISNAYRGDISIEKNTDGLLEINANGNLALSIVAEHGLVQNIKAYVQENVAVCQRDA